MYKAYFPYIFKTEILKLRYRKLLFCTMRPKGKTKREKRSKKESLELNYDNRRSFIAEVIRYSSKKIINNLKIYYVYSTKIDLK